MTWQGRTLFEIIERAKREVREDILAGRVPNTASSFSELHDYVDANEYGGLCEDWFWPHLAWDDEDAWYGSKEQDEQTNFMNRVQDEVDKWLRWRKEKGKS